MAVSLLFQCHGGFWPGFGCNPGPNGPYSPHVHNGCCYRGPRNSMLRSQLTISSCYCLLHISINSKSRPITKGIKINIDMNKKAKLHIIAFRAGSPSTLSLIKRRFKWKNELIPNLRKSKLHHFRNQEKKAFWIFSLNCGKTYAMNSETADLKSKLHHFLRCCATCLKV